MQAGSGSRQVVVVAALVAACVAALVGGATAWFVAHGSDGSDAAPTTIDGALDTDIAVPLVHRAAECDVRFDVPGDAIAIRLHAWSEHGPLVVRARFGDHDAGAWDAEETDPAEDVQIDLAEHAYHEFVAGPLVVRVEADRGIGPGEKADVHLRADVIRMSVGATIDAGAAWSGATTPESGFRRTIAVKVPAGAKALRIDLADAPTDLDLHVDTKHPSVLVADAEAASASLGAAEWLVLDGTSDPPIPAGGTVWVNVTDPSSHPFPVAFRLVTSLGRDPPADLAAVPPLEFPTDPRERALAAVVEVLTDDGGGAGTIVSDRGLVLTAYHVVEAAARAVAAGRPDDAPRIVIAVTTDPREVARDLFVAEVRHADRDVDLAMLQIVAGVRGAPLPFAYRFPCAKLSRKSRLFLGEALFTAGYPLAGGTGTRVPLTVSRGVVSGYDRAAKCVEIKTDAVVSPGSSGGAAFDDRWELIGVPVSTTDGGSGGNALGNVVPIEAIPQGWWR